MTFTRILTGLFASSILINCGGGSDGGSNNNNFSGSTSAATATTENSQSLAEAATAATARSIESQEVGIPLGVEISESVDIASTDLEPALDTILNHLSFNSLPTGVEFEEPCDVSGSITIDLVGVSANAQQIPDSGTIRARFDQCNQGDDVILNGTMEIRYSGGFDDNRGFRNFTTEFDLASGGLQLTGQVSCSNFGTDCSYAEDFSLDGVTYRIEGAEVDQNGATGTFNVSARIYDENEGFIDMTATNATVNNTGNICSGSIDISDSTNANVVQVTFPDCDNYVVTFGGVSNTFPQ